MHPHFLPPELEFVLTSTCTRSLALTPNYLIFSFSFCHLQISGGQTLSKALWGWAICGWVQCWRDGWTTLLCSGRLLILVLVAQASSTKATLPWTNCLSVSAAAAWHWDLGNGWRSGSWMLTLWGDGLDWIWSGSCNRVTSFFYLILYNWTGFMKRSDTKSHSDANYFGNLGMARLNFKWKKTLFKKIWFSIWIQNCYNKFLSVFCFF